MRILANENFPGPVVRALRERGDDVASVREDQPGATDEVVLARAQSEHRLLVTCDKVSASWLVVSGCPPTAASCSSG